MWAQTLEFNIIKQQRSSRIESASASNVEDERDSINYQEVQIDNVLLFVRMQKDSISEDITVTGLEPRIKSLVGFEEVSCSR